MTSFMPAMTSAAICVGGLAAGSTDDQSSACRPAVRRSISLAACSLRAIEGDALLEIVPQCFAREWRQVARQEISTQILGADRIGFGLLQRLALVVARNGHRKTEAGYQREQRQRRRLHRGEVVALALLETMTVSADEIAGKDRKPLRD